MEFMTRKLKEECEKLELTKNLEKTKYICIGEGKKSLNLTAGNKLNQAEDLTI